MLFNSLQFLIFFPIVVSLYFMLSHKYRLYLLLCASYYFYMCWKPEYSILIFISTVIDYFAGIQMGKQSARSCRRKYLILSLVSNLGLLFSFKYFNFFSGAFNEFFDVFRLPWQIPYLNVLLPVGISFYTFQTLSYSIDVYRGNQAPEKDFFVFALYVSFFPQLVAGPIERSINLLPQFYVKQKFDYDRIKSGLLQMLWGFFKKVVIADRLAVYVDAVYNNPHDYSGFPLLLATYFFAFQIYCDFSGYSDIAIGVARIFGINLMKNFNRPYFAKSIAEFWKRWHISLSTWFRDYLYIPLGGNRVGLCRWYFNIFIVFFISGIWHGANWTFMLWGAIHGLYFIFSAITKELRLKLAQGFRLTQAPIFHKSLRVFITFHLVLFSWIFFRANSISDARYVLLHIFAPIQMPGKGFLEIMDKAEWGIAIMAIIFMESIHLIQRNKSIYDWLSRKPVFVRWSIYYLAMISIIILGQYNTTQFIYFQF